MRKRIQVGWISLVLLMIPLALTACVRPYPGGEASAAQPTVNPIDTEPVVVPIVPVNTPDAAPATLEPVDILEPTPAPIEPTAVPAAESTYIVQVGDTLYKIAIAHDVTVEDIAAANGIVNIDSLEVGQELLIPGPGSQGLVETEDTGQETVEEPNTDADATSDTDSAAPETAAGGVHVVQPGDNLFRIGLQYGCSVEQLARHNGIATPNRISVGMEIQIPECN